MAKEIPTIPRVAIADLRYIIDLCGILVKTRERSKGFKRW
jgi:hypothetical protein